MSSYSSRIYENILDVFNKMQETYSPSITVNNISRWIQPSETEEIEGLSDPDYDILFDLTSNIIQSIPNELFNETDVNIFISDFTETTSSITTYTVTGNIIWNVDLKDKFLWIAMMLAAKTTHKVIPHLIKLIDGNEYILKHEDSNGNNCFTLACWNISVLNELLKVFPTNYLKDMTTNNVSPLDLLAYTGGIIQLFESKIISFDDILSYANPHYKTNVIHSCSMNVDNTAVLEYFIGSKKLTRGYMYAVDKNGNFPLLISCLLGSTKHIDLMLKSKLYDQDIITINNGAGRNIISYANNDILKYFIDFIDEGNFFDLKFYNIIGTDDGIFQQFTKSKLFTINILSKDYPNGPVSNTTNLLNWLFFKERSFLDYLINCNDNKIVEIMKQVFTIKRSILAMSFDCNTKLPLLIIKSKYMTNDLLKEPYNGSTLINKLVNSLNENNNNNILYDVGDIGELTECIIDSPYITNDIISDDFINFCAKNFCDLMGKLVEKGFIGDITSVIYSMLNFNSTKGIIRLFENNHINSSQLKGRTHLLVKLIQSDCKLLKMLLSNDILNEEIIMLFTHNGIIDIDTMKLDYIIGDDIWILLIKSKCLTKEKLNAYNDMSGSIVKNVRSNKHFQLLLENRPDLDHTLFFKKKPDSFFLSKCSYGDIEVVNYLIKHHMFTKGEYDYLITGGGEPYIDSIFSSSNSLVVEQLIKHKYFDDKIINIKFNGNNNLLQHIINDKFENDLVSYVINHPKMTSEYFNHCNNEGNNCLMVALYAESYVPLIINCKYFEPNMMRIKNIHDVSAEDIIYDHLDYDFLSTYFKLFPKSDLPYRHFTGGNTIVHKLIKDGGIYFLLELLLIFAFDIMIINNNKNSTPLHKITSNIENFGKLETILEMKQLIVKKEHFYLPNKYSETPLTNIIQNIHPGNTSVLEKLINLKIFTQSDLNIPLPKGITIAEYILDGNLPLLDILDKYNFNIPSSLEQKGKDGEPLYFKLVRSTLGTAGEHYSKFINSKSLYLTNLLGETLLFQIINTDQKLCTELINMGTVNDEMLVPYLDKLISQYPLTIKYLLNSLPKLFTKGNLLYCISQCIDLNSDVLGMLLGSKCCTFDIFTEIYNKSELLNSLLSSTIGLKYIFENNLITQEMLKEDNYKLMFTIDNPIYLKQISEIIFHSNENICDAKQKGKTIFHKYAMYPNLSNLYVRRYIQYSQDKTLPMLLVRDNNKKTFLDYLVERGYVDDIMDIIKIINGDLLSNLLANQDNNGKNIIMKCCKEGKLHSILQSIRSYITKGILEQFDNNRNLTLMYIARYTLDLFKDIFKPEPSITLWENVHDDDLFSITARYNYKNLEILLSYNELVDAYKNFDKCFVVACRYEPYSIGLLLNSGKIDLKKCNGVIQYDEYTCYANFLQIACRYNEGSARELISSNINLQEYIKNVQYVQINNRSIVAFNAFKLALLYEPNVVTLLLDSKYGSTKMITGTDVLCRDNSCLIEIIEKQMGSYIRLAKSKHFKESMYENPIGNLSIKYSNLFPYAEISNKLLKYKDIPCSEIHKNVCSTCFSNKNRVVFAPCGHKSCVMCSTKLYQCPQCRDKITDRIVYN